MANWQERLRQAKQNSEQENKKDKEQENALYQRLFGYLDKFKVRKLLEDVKREVWEVGSIREVNDGANVSDGKGGLCAALQLYYIYEDAQQIYQSYSRRGTFGEDLSGSYRTGFYKIVNRNIGLAVGSVYIPRDFNPEPTTYSSSLIKAGDYMYLAFTTPGEQALKKWGFSGVSTGGTPFINLSSQDQKVSEFIEERLLKRVGADFRIWLPLNLKEEGKKNIERYMSQGLLRKG